LHPNRQGILACFLDHIPIHEYFLDDMIIVLATRLDV